jgi:hypothetical protein
MSFYFQPQGNWAALNKEAALLFAPGNERADIRVFAGAAHALIEFTLGFREQFPLKKKYFYFKDLDPHFQLSATALAKAGLQVTALTLDAISDAEKINALVNGFDREFGFIFFPLDNPATGQVYPFKEFEAALISKTLPHLKVSYSQHRTVGLKPALDRNEAVVYAFPQALAAATFTSAPVALLALGDRMRFGSPVAAALSPVTSADLHSLQKSFFREADERAVQKFESKGVGGAQPLFKAGDTARIFDRAVMYFEDMDGYAFLSVLGELLGDSLRPASLDWRFETTSLSRWGGIRTMDWLKSHGLKPELIRGLISIDARLLTPEFEKQFATAREHVLKQQNG